MDHLSTNTVCFTDHTGKQVEAKLGLADYREAKDAGLTLSQLYACKYPTKADQPDAFTQFIHAAGIRIKADRKRGIPASSMREILDGNVSRVAGVVVRPDGTNRGSISGRFLYPEIILEMINQNLLVSKEDYLSPWENAIALRSTVTSARVDQPLINVTAPEGSRAQPIAQGAEAPVMVSISLAERSRTIPTKSIGLEITEEALQAATIDLVGIAVSSQARGERIARIEADMANMFNGDTDFNVAAITAVTAATFDAASTTAANFTHKAFVKFLRQDYQKLTVTHIFCDIDAAFDVEGRVGRPVWSGDVGDASTEQRRMPVDYSIENLGIPSPKLILLPTAIVGAGTIFAMDAQYAMQEITNVNATYSATEEFVLRKTHAMRFDYGVGLYKLYDEAWTGMTFA